MFHGAFEEGITKKEILRILININFCEILFRFST